MLMKTTLLLPIVSVRTLVALAAAVCGVASLAAAEVVGSDHVISETRSVSGFHGVELRGGGDVVVTQGDSEGLVIDAEDNILPLIESTVGGDGILHLGMKPHAGGVTFKKPVIFKLAVKTLDKVVIAGSGNFRTASLSSDHLRIELPGSGNVAVDRLKTETVTAEINGSGDVKLGGEARSQKVTIDGSGDYEAQDLKTDTTTLEINGSGDGQVWAEGTLAVEINGSGDVGYRGGAKLNKSVHGSGEVHPLEKKG